MTRVAMPLPTPSSLPIWWTSRWRWNWSWRGAGCALEYGQGLRNDSSRHGHDARLLQLRCRRRCQCLAGDGAACGAAPSTRSPLMETPAPMTPCWPCGRPTAGPRTPCRSGTGPYPGHAAAGPGHCPGRRRGHLSD